MGTLWLYNGSEMLQFTLTHVVQAGDTQEMAGVEKFFLDGQRKEPL